MFTCSDYSWKEKRVHGKRGFQWELTGDNINFHGSDHIFLKTKVNGDFFETNLQHLVLAEALCMDNCNPLDTDFTHNFLNLRQYGMLAYVCSLFIYVYSFSIFLLFTVEKSSVSF